MADRLIACIDSLCRADVWGCAKEYKRAADELLDSVSVRSLPIDSVARPLAFLYRHAFELTIKGFLASGNSVKTGLYRHPSGHDLVQLWSEAKPFAEGIFDSFDALEQPTLREKLDEIGRIAEQIGEHDAQSFAFRYPTTKDGKPNLQGLRYLDLNALSSGIEESMGILGWMADHLEYYQQASP